MVIRLPSGASVGRSSIVKNSQWSFAVRVASTSVAHCRATTAPSCNPGRRQQQRRLGPDEPPQVALRALPTQRHQRARHGGGGQRHQRRRPEEEPHRLLPGRQSAGPGRSPPAARPSLIVSTILSELLFGNRPDEFASLPPEQQH